jgi:hypothetical protein
MKLEMGPLLGPFFMPPHQYRLTRVTGSPGRRNVPFLFVVTENYLVVGMGCIG